MYAPHPDLLNPSSNRPLASAFTGYVFSTNGTTTLRKYVSCRTSAFVGWSAYHGRWENVGATNTALSALCRPSFLTSFSPSPYRLSVPASTGSTYTTGYFPSF